jgi:beta-glucosidase
LEGLRNHANGDFEIMHTEGCSLTHSTTTVPEECFGPLGGEIGQGLNASYFDIEDFHAGTKNAAHEKIEPRIDFSWGWAAPANGVPRVHYAARWTGTLQMPESGEYLFTVSAQEGMARVWFDDILMLDAWNDADRDNFEGRYTNRQEQMQHHFTNGQHVQIRIEYEKTGTRGGIHFGWKTPNQRIGIQAAEDLARSADVVVIACGLSNQFEGGNYDRKQFDLPAPQEALIQRVARANPNVVVVLNNGTPVQMRPWIDQVPAVLEAYYPGQEGGNALARILLGEVNPSGKLPDTIPNSWDEVPSMQAYPGSKGQALYSEGLNVGYRFYDSKGIQPVFPFGHGLSYTDFVYDKPQLSSSELKSNNDELQLSVRVTNGGTRFGREIVQLYLIFPNPSNDRPPKQLIHFDKVSLKPQESETVAFTLRSQDLLTYNADAERWEIGQTQFEIAVGGHPYELQSMSITVTA